MRVGMALPKAVGCVVVLLIICYSLEKQGYRGSLNVFIEDLIGTNPSHTLAREKRLVSINSTDYVLNAVIRISDMEKLQTFLNKLSQQPFRINSTSVITRIDATTVCTPNMDGYQCRCEENYAWSYNNCISHGCDSIIGDTCGCINGLPTDDQYCLLNTSQTETTPPTPSPTPTNETTPPTPSPTPTNESVDIDVVLVLHTPVSSVPSDFINRFRDTLTNFEFPYTITDSLKVIDVNFTTGCFLNSTGGVQCECEDQFAWSCEKCLTYGSCSHATNRTCGCINGFPFDGDFCEPITNVLECPTPSPGMNTTTPVMNTTTEEMTTTPMTTTPMLTTTPVTTTTMTTPVSTTTPMLTTTPVTTTTMTTPVSTTTPMLTTTPVTTTTTTPVSTTTTEVEISMDRTFEESFNIPDSQVYQDFYNSIEIESKKHISNFSEVESIKFRSGSTICDFRIRAISFSDKEKRALKVGLFEELAKKDYPMIFDGQEHLVFDRPIVFLGENLNVKCGPPPEDLNFGSEWTPEWRRDNELVRPDELHKISRNDGTLTVSKFFGTDNGTYECRLKRRDNTVFRRTSNGPLSHKQTPIIRVTPVRRVECKEGEQVLLECSVNFPYEVEFKDTDSGTDQKIKHQFTITDCEKETFTCQEKTYTKFSETITLEFFEGSADCNDNVFGAGKEGDMAEGLCEEDEVGEKKAVCLNGVWKEQEPDNCVLKPLQELLEQSQSVTTNSLPAFLKELLNVTTSNTDDIVESPANINATVEILSNLANLSIVITEPLMTDILLTASVLTRNETKDQWNVLNKDNDETNEKRSSSSVATSASSIFLESLENFSGSLNDDSFNISTPLILLNKTTFTDTFNADIEFFNSTVVTDIPESDGESKSITVITFASMDNVLPARDQKKSEDLSINGRVVLVRSSGTINNISFTFDILNTSLQEPKCVFWNFSLFEGIGGWDDNGCELVHYNQTVTCNCNHLTSFSILMSPHGTNDPVARYITYVGVAISMASLVICLIIEAVIWRKIRKNNTSYLRHVSIVNIAVSLLIANIWFIIGAAISNGKNDYSACSTATFFIHLFYLALFFWMFASALLLLYRTVNVFDGGLSKTSMLAIGFILGYGAPVIIAVITIAVTAPSQQYIQDNNVCWLRGEKSFAFLAFVIPALVIVAINLVILLVVIYKMLRRRAVGNAAQAAERHVLVVIIRSLAVLTPIFGLTWLLGIGLMVEPFNKGLHISFAFFNSLQGFFILVFGVLLDKKVRSEMAAISQSSGNGTRSTSAGHSSSSGLGFFRNWRRGRDGYNVSSSAAGESQSFSNS